MNKPIILLTGDGDLDIAKKLPDVTMKILNNPFIISWYTQNCTLKHPKLKPLPIGISIHTYHKSDQLLINQNCHYLSNNKSLKIILDAHLTKSHSSRIQLEENFKNNSNVIIIKNILSRNELFKKYKTADFVICPRENGYDTHRFWEAICFGVYRLLKIQNLVELLTKICP